MGLCCCKPKIHNWPTQTLHAPKARRIYNRPVYQPPSYQPRPMSLQEAREIVRQAEQRRQHNGNYWPTRTVKPRKVVFLQ